MAFVCLIKILNVLGRQASPPAQVTTILNRVKKSF
jgi:hypothetical protein